MDKGRERLADERVECHRTFTRGTRRIGSADRRLAAAPSRPQDRRVRSPLGCQTSACMAGPWVLLRAGCRGRQVKVL